MPGALARPGRHDDHLSMNSTREPILIWGAGAIGGVLGAWWARAGVPVLMVDVVPEIGRAHV